MTNQHEDPEEIRGELAENAPQLWKETSYLAQEWLEPAIRLLDARTSARRLPKTINDPVWGAIELLPWEVVLLDTPLMQRLRGIRQLGMAHHVYPAAGHNRLEHSLGVVEASERILRALQRNAAHRRDFGPKVDETVPDPSDEDRISIRLGALLHDVGHGPFSHASESLLRRRLSNDFDVAEECLAKHFVHPGALSTSETIAVLFVLSQQMKHVLTHERFESKTRPADLSLSIAARIVGSPLHVSAGYLARVVNGPLDADKLDYMARDSHHSGLPLGLDLNRIIGKLEVVTKEEQDDEGAIVRRHHLGISASGLAAYEQMIIARVFLYDRLYYHHKVRTADAMAYSLIETAEEEIGRPMTLSELLLDVSDDALIAVVGGNLTSGRTPSGKKRSRDLSAALRRRDLFRRAFVFAERFIAGVPDNMPEAGETRSLIWTKVRNFMATGRNMKEIGDRIFERALSLGELETFTATAKNLRREHVIVDLSSSPKVTMTADGDRVTDVDELMYARLDDGTVQKPNLFFDPAKWSLAYQTQKHAGYVFTPREFVHLIAVASAIVFFETFNLLLSENAARLSKTQAIDLPKWVAEAAARGICSAECQAAFTRDTVRLKRIGADELRLPSDWEREDPKLRERLAAEIGLAFRRGFPATMHGAVIDVIEHLSTFVMMIERTGRFAHETLLLERSLQDALRSHLESRSVPVEEGSKYGGGETDLVVPGPIVIENKKRGVTADPLAAGAEYEWQTRRYSIAISATVSVVVLAYKPSSTAGLLQQSKRLAVVAVRGVPEQRVQLRVVIPYGHGNPSDERPPKGP